jgi:type I restriction-modification system DNA methylase subunit
MDAAVHNQIVNFIWGILGFTPIAGKTPGRTYSCYDGACGSGAVFTAAEKRLAELAAKKKKKVSIHLFGQEVQGETYAIAKADLLLKGDGAQADNISFGSTLSNDSHSTREFDFMLSNKKEKKRRGKIQFIDAASLKTPFRKNLGDKNCELSISDRKKILDLYLKFEENEYSRIFNQNDFAYWKTSVCRPKYDEKGNILKDKKGNPQADADLTDTEQIPFTYDGGIEAFFEKEVKPYAKDAWIDRKQTKTGYEISFTKYFYNPIELRPLEEITADIKALEAETKGLLEKILED